MSADELIADYRAAYAAANGKELREYLSYENGWFVFRLPEDQCIDGRYRRDTLKRMRDRLRRVCCQPPLVPALYPAQQMGEGE